MGEYQSSGVGWAGTGYGSQTYTFHKDTGLYELVSEISVNGFRMASIGASAYAISRNYQSVHYNNKDYLAAIVTNNHLGTELIQVMLRSGSSYCSVYIYQSSVDTDSKGDLTGETVVSIDQSMYPADGIQGDYWYVRRSGYDLSKGALNNTVSSLTSTQYPNDGVQNGYWYVYKNSVLEYIQGSAYYGEVYDINPSKYPSNGRHSDGYWYVKVA